MAGDLVAFVPRLATELADAGARWTSVDGSMLSADISGFTALSEKLAGKGKAGAEEITSLINTCFTALIDAAYGYGGEVIKFGGDALLVLYRGDDHERRVANASLSMQRALHSSGAAKRANLTMTVGASHGPFDVFVAGSGYHELLITGPAASQVIHLEGEADKGETLVSPEIATLLPADRLGRFHAGGVAVSGDPLDPPSDPEVRPPTGAALSRFVPPAVVEQLEAFSGLGGEHRIVTVGFLMLTGISDSLDDHGPAATAEALSHIVDRVMEVTARYGVTALHTDIAPDGLKFVLCAGAPVNPGDTSDAMLRAALDIADIDSPFVLRQGVQTGRVFAGFLGSPYRRTYTLMGDPVNTAARMLGKAGDRDVVAVQTVVDDTRTLFVTDPLEPFLVKGKTEPISAHLVRSGTDSVRRGAGGSRLVGRDAELAVLTSAIGELGEVVEVVGPAGAGKSRLLDAAWDAAEGLTIFQGSCTPYGSASPYSLFRPLLRTGTGIAPDADAVTTGRVVSGVVHDLAPHLAPMLPLLAVPFGAKVDDTPEVEAIAPEFRRARIHEVVVDFLDATLDGPVLLVAEDLHWVDDASAELVDHLVGAARSRSWAAVLTRRPEGTWQLDQDHDHALTVLVEPLNEDDIRELAIECTSRSLSDRELDLVVGRSQGNPLFAIEIARALAAGTGDLPDTIERVIAARIDDLAPDVRRVLRIASVLGTTFGRDELEPVLAVEAPGASLGVEAMDGIFEPRPRGQIGFTHALWRDAAYEGLPFRQRRHLHGVVATTLETRAASPEEIADLLSLHYSEARDHRQAWHYSTIAGDRARSQHAYAESAVAYERALASARWADTTGTERADVAEVLGDMYYVLARFESARRAFDVARRFDGDVARTAGLLRRIGLVQEREGRAGLAVRWYQRAIEAVPERTRRPELLAARAHAVLARAGIEHRRGDNEACLASAAAALADAEQAGDAAARALALERMHLATVYLRRPDADDTGPRALEAFRAIDDKSGQARTLINLGIEAYFGDDWTAASTHYLEAAEIGRASGNVVLAETAALNSGEILSDQGHCGRAVELFDDARRNWEAVGYPVGVAAATAFLAVAAMRQGDLGRAGAAVEDARRRLVELDVSELIDDLDSRALELALLSGESPVEAASELLERLGAGHPLAPRVRRSRGLARWRTGDTAGAVDDLRSAYDDTAEGSYDRGVVAMALARIDGSDAGLDREATAVWRSLDVAVPPPLVADDLMPVSAV